MNFHIFHKDEMLTLYTESYAIWSVKAAMAVMHLTPTACLGVTGRRRCDDGMIVLLMLRTHAMYVGE